MLSKKKKKKKWLIEDKQMWTFSSFISNYLESHVVL